MFAPKTEETFLLCTTKDNFSLGNNAVHIMIGSDSIYQLQYDHIPYVDYLFSGPFLNSPKNIGVISILNNIGNPIQMKKIDSIYFNIINSEAIKFAVNPCSDFVFTLGGNLGYEFNYEGTFIDSDSMYMFFNYSNCTLSDCEFFNAKDSIKVCAQNDSIQVQLSDYFNLNELAFEILVDGNLFINNFQANVESGSFSFPIPSNQNGIVQLNFSYPNPDTMVVEFENTNIDFGVIPNDTLCINYPVFEIDSTSPLGGFFYGPGMISNQFYPLLAGVGTHTLEYVYSLNGCNFTDIEIITIDDCLNISDYDLNNFSIYPNPFNSELIIDEENPLDSEIKTIKLYDSYGRLLLQKHKTENKYILNLNDLENGTYILEVLINNKVILREKVVKS
jgi:hypothetical protein